MQHIGVIGAGVMGAGIVADLRIHGLNVTLVDLDNEILKKAEVKIIENIRLASLMLKQRDFPSIDVLVESVNYTTDLKSLSHVDFVVECVSEDISVKQRVFTKIDTYCRQEVCFASNTSCIPITKIGGFTQRASKVVGIHFMNPVPVKKAVEVIRGYHTSAETLEVCNRLLSLLGKEAVIINDGAGFVTNRISHLLMNEAACIIQENIATPEQVDRIFRECYNHKMGPLETADLIGIDTVVNSLDVLFEIYKDSKYRCCPYLRKMSDANLLGRKSGRGFYKYESLMS